MKEITGNIFSTLYHFVTTKLGPNFIFQQSKNTWKWYLFRILQKKYLLKHEVLFSTGMNLKISNNGDRTQLHLHRFFHSISGYQAGLQIFHCCVWFLWFLRLFCGLGSVGVKMFLEIPVEQETLPADIAVVWPGILVKSLMGSHVALVGKSFIADSTFKWLLSWKKLKKEGKSESIMSSVKWN